MKNQKLRDVNKEQMTPKPMLLISVVLPSYWKYSISVFSALILGTLSVRSRTPKTKVFSVGNAWKSIVKLSEIHH